MTKLVLWVAALSLPLTTLAQEFKLVHKTNFPVETRLKLLSADRTNMLVGTTAEIAMMDAVNGKTLWTVNFKKDYGTKKAEEIYRVPRYGAICMMVKNGGKGDAQEIYVDERTGQKIDLKGRAEAVPQAGYSYVKTKTRSRNQVTDAGSNTVFDLDYERPDRVASSGKGRTTTATVVASGVINWKKTFPISVIRPLCENTGGSEGFSGGDFITMDKAGDVIFVIYEGITALDSKTGDILWTTTLDNADFDFGLFRSRQTLGRAGMPTVTDNAVIIADLTKGKRAIKKLDIKTGQVLWQGEKLSDDVVVPQIEVTDGVVLVRQGGKLLTNAYIPGQSGNADVCKVEEKMVGDFNVIALDEATGKELWRANANKDLKDKFGGLITNMLVEGGKVYVATDKFIHCLDPKTGKASYSVAVSALKLGDPTELFEYKGKLMVEAEKGIAAIAIADGKVAYATSTGKNMGIFFKGENMFVWNVGDKEQATGFVRIDPETGAIKGKSPKVYYAFFTADGNEFVKFDADRVYRYNVQ